MNVITEGTGERMEGEKDKVEGGISATWGPRPTVQPRLRPPQIAYWRRVDIGGVNWAATDKL